MEWGSGIISVQFSSIYISMIQWTYKSIQWHLVSPWMTKRSEAVLMKLKSTKSCSLWMRVAPCNEIIKYNNVDTGNTQNHRSISTPNNLNKWTRVSSDINQVVCYTELAEKSLETVWERACTFKINSTADWISHPSVTVSPWQLDSQDHTDWSKPPVSRIQLLTR